MEDKDLKQEEINRAKQNLYWFCRSITRNVNTYIDLIEELHYNTDRGYKTSVEHGRSSINIIDNIINDLAKSRANLNYLISKAE